MSEESKATQITKRLEDLRDKVKKLDGFDYIVIPLIYLEEFVKRSISAAYDAYIKWDQKRFNDSLPKDDSLPKE